MTVGRHRSRDASWETAAYFLFLAHSPLAYSNLGREDDRVMELGMVERIDLTAVCSPETRSPYADYYLCLYFILSSLFVAFAVGCLSPHLSI